MEQRKKPSRKQIEEARGGLSRSKRLTVNLVLALVMALFLFPIVWMGIISFKTQEQIQNMPPSVFSSFTLNNYREIFGANIKEGFDQARAKAVAEVIALRSKAFLRSVMNSAILSISSVLIAAIVGIMTAYGLSRYKSKNKETLGFIFLSFRFLPELVVIIPLYILFNKFGLYNTYFGLIWVYILIPLPMIIWITRTYFEDLSPDLEQAAMLDGYSAVKTFFKIVLPLVRPGIAAAILLSFIYAWNNMIFGLTLASTDLMPVTVSILIFSDITDVNYGRIAAAIIISIIPMIALSQIASKYLVSGLSMGAVKG